MKPLLFSILFNSTVTIIFVLLNIWVLNNGLEETFISLALMFGLIMTIGNALFVFSFSKK